MDFKLTEEQKQIKSLIRQFAKREVDIDHMWELSDKAARAKTLEELRAIQPMDLVKKLNDVGLRQLCVPTKYGGGGVTQGGCMTRAIASEEAGYSMAIGCRLLATPWNHCAQIAGPHTTEEQKDWFFTQFMANPTMHVGHVGSEPSGMTDFSLPYDEPGYSMRTIAHKDGNEWVINGDKMFSSASPVANLIQVIARTDKNAPISKSLSCFFVPKDAPGLTQEVNRLIGGEIFGNCQNHFDNVRVPESNLIGEVNKGGLVFADTIAAKMIVYVSLFGHAQKVYDGLVEYAKERIGGGRPIIQHSHIAQMLGEMSIKMEAVRSLIYRASWENDQRQLAGASVDLYWSLSVFHYARKVCWDLCQIALEIYGGVGTAPEMPVERFLRRVSTWYITGGVPSMNAIKCSMLHNDHKIVQG